MPTLKPLQSGATDAPDAPQSSIELNEDSARAAGYQVQHQQYRQINGPKGPINFPASMSDDQITQAMRKLYPPKQATPIESGWASDEHWGKVIGALNTGWETLNTPIGDFGGHAGRTQRLLTQGLAMGKTPEQAEQIIQDIPKGKSVIPWKEHPGPREVGIRTAAEGMLASKDASIPKTLSEMFTTPLAIATFGVGGLLSKLGLREVAAIQQMNKANDALQELRRANASAETLQRAATELNTARKEAQSIAAVHRGARAVEAAAGAGFGVQGGAQAYEAATAYQNAKTPKDRVMALSQAASGSGQALLGLTAIGHGATGGVPDAEQHFTRAARTLKDTADYLKAVPVPGASAYEVKAKPSIVTPQEIKTPQEVAPAQLKTSSSQPTGLDIREKIAKLKADIEAAEAATKVRLATPVEQVKQMVAKEQGTYFGPKAARDLPGAEDVSKYPAQAGKGVEVPGVVDTKEAAKKAAEPKPIEAAPLPKAPEARPEPPAKQPIQKKSYSGYQIIEGRKPEPVKQTIPERPAGLNATSPEAVEEARQRQALRDYQLDATNRATSGSKVGRQVAPPEATQPEVKPVPTTKAPERSGEPVRAAEKPALNKALFTDAFHQRLIQLGATKEEWSQIVKSEVAADFWDKAVEKGKSPQLDHAIQLADHYAKQDVLPPAKNRPEELKQATLGQIKEDAKTIEAKGEPRSLRGDLGERPPQAKVLNPMERLALQRERIQKYVEDHPGVSKQHAATIVAEQMRKEQGSLGGGEPRDPSQRRADREEKINAWIKMLRDPGTSPQALDTAYKMLRAYGVEGDEIIRRVSGAEDFARTGQEGDRLPEPSKEALEERIGPGELTEAAKKAWDKRRDAFGNVHPDDPRLQSNAVTEMQAWAEGRRQGAEDIARVKSPTTEWLEQQAALKDPRKAEREDERGSLSFKRISEEERKAANPLQRLADALDRVASFVEHPRLSDTEAATEQTARNIMRKAFSERDRSHSEVMKALEGAIQRHDSPVNERQNFIDFMDAAESGAHNLDERARKAYEAGGGVVLSPEDQALATVLHDMFDERWEKIKEIKGLEGDGIENYLAHMWERPNKAFKTLNGLLTGRRPLEGPAKFLKSRFYQYASMGVDNGLTPVTWNPIRLQLQALFDTDRFIMAHDIKDQFKDAGLAQWVGLKDYKNVPPGWSRLNDKIFQPKAMGEGALKEFGTYYAPDAVARIFNRYLEPGLGANPVFKAVRNYGNRLNMISLGVSGYHGTMITLVSATSDLALGLQKITSYGDFGGGLKDVLRGTVGTFFVRSAARDYALGKQIQAEALDPTGNPQLQKYVDAIVKGGGGFKQDSVYTNSLSDRKGFVNWLKLGVTGHPFQMIDKGVRTLSSPIMEKFVPRVKLGAAAHMMEAKLAALDKAGVADENTIATEMGKIWDSIDNRAGQMRYDNLFWNRMGKDLAFVSVRAVGWDLGSIREYGGAVGIDLPRQIAKGLRGERPELTSRLAFTIATPITIGIIGGMLHYYMTGKAPTKTEDYYYPGPDGAKVSFPSYMKDYFAFKEHPLKTAVNKLHPTFGQMADFYHNSDFYGTEIYHPGDDKFKKGWDILKWYSKSYVPLSYKGIATRVERGEPISSAAGGYAGFMPAPASVGQSKAENLAYDLAVREWKQGPRTSASAERFHLVQKFEHQVGLGQWDKNTQAELTQAWQNKRIQDSDIAAIYSNYNIPRLQREFKKLELPDALAVMREADPNERVQLKPYLLQKYGQLERYPLDQQKQYDKEIRGFLQ